MTILGLCGQPASGKDTVADFFVSKGFAHISLSNILREEMTKQGLPLDREHMQIFSRQAKKDRGLGYLAELAADKIVGNTIVSSIRGSAEVELFRRRFGDQFELLNIDAPLRTRYDRARKRNRPGDDISLELFKAQEDRERADPGKAHEVDKVIGMSDRAIDNSGSIQELYKKLEDIL